MPINAGQWNWYINFAINYNEMQMKCKVNCVG